MKILKSEEEIMDSWKDDTEKPEVSICCITYNHEQFIEDALIGFLNQVTNFPFEILIHDDASTDNTQDIIKKYKEKYPDLIKPIYQKKNQHSQGVKINTTYNYSRARGKYIALCEGDDYWTDNFKLQYQVNIMRKFPKCTICYHPAVELNMDNNQKKIVCQNYNKDDFDNFKSVILGRGAYMPTQALLFVNKLDKLIEVLEETPIGDYFVQVVMTLEGKCFYINKVMSVYRRNAPGAWTTMQKQLDNNRKYSFEMLHGMAFLKKKYRRDLVSKLFTEVYLHYAKSYIFSYKNNCRKFLMFNRILVKAMLEGFYRVPKLLIKEVISHAVFKNSN